MPAPRRTVRAAGLLPATAAPARLRVGIIGAGRVGSVLGAALAAAGHDVVAASGLSAASAERLHGLGERVGLARREDDAGAPVHQAPRDPEPDAPAAAGHQGGASLHRAHAASSPS